MSGNFAKVKEAVDLPTYIGEYVELKEHDGYYTGRCPVHGDGQEKNPSFTVFQAGDNWKWACKSCGKGGDHFDFAVFIGEARDHIDGLHVVANKYGINIESKKRPEADLSVQAIRKQVTDFAHEALLKDEKALAFLATRGITRDIIKKWKIGISDGRLYDRFKARLKDDTRPVTSTLAMSGIAKKHDDGRVTNYIAANMLMYPVYLGSKISHWDLRECSKEKKLKYQIPKDKRLEGCLFFNQAATNKHEFWLVEGRDDVIFMEEAGFPTAGLMGGPTNQQIEMLQGLVEFSEHEPGAGKTRKIHILMDNDPNTKAGQNKTERLSGALCDYHDLVIHELPEGLDPHEFLLGGGDITTLSRRAVKHGESRVREQEGRYYMLDKDGKPKVITNFTILVDYEIENELGEKSYLVNVVKDKNSRGPFFWDSTEWDSEASFIRWIGKVGGEYDFAGNKDTLREIKKYIFEKNSPKKIKLVDGLGEVIPGMRIFDNGVLVDGKRKMANDMGVTWVNKGDIEGVRTKTWGSGRQLCIPSKTFEVKQIMENFRDFYFTPRMIWPAIGLAAMCVYYTKLCDDFSDIPIGFMYGPKGSGKSDYADWIKSMTGAGPLPSPNKSSTYIGIERYASAHYNLCITTNEFKGMSKEDLARAWFDRDPQIKGKFTNDKRTTDMGFNSAGIFTNIQAPLADDVLNRMVIQDFHKFVPDVTRSGRYKKVFIKGVENSMNFSFMEELVASEFGNNISETIEKVSDGFLSDGRIQDSRQCLSLAIVAGCFVQAGRSLGLWQMFEELGMDKPDQGLVTDTFFSMAACGQVLMREAHPMRRFFEYAEALYAEGRLENCMQDGYDGRGRYLEFNIAMTLAAVQREDSKRDRMLKNLNKREISKMLKNDCNATYHSTSINGKSRQLYKVHLKDIMDNYGFVYHVGTEDSQEIDETESRFESMFDV